MILIRNKIEVHNWNIIVFSEHGTLEIFFGTLRILLWNPFMEPWGFFYRTLMDPRGEFLVCSPSWPSAFKSPTVATSKPNLLNRPKPFSMIGSVVLKLPCRVTRTTNNIITTGIVFLWVQCAAGIKRLVVVLLPKFKVVNKTTPIKDCKITLVEISLLCNSYCTVWGLLWQQTVQSPRVYPEDKDCLLS